MSNYVTVSEATKRSGLSVEHLRHLCRAGKLEAMQYGITWAIDPESLETYLRTERKTGPKPNSKRRATLERKAEEL